MHKGLTFTQNIFGVVALIGIIALSTVATLSLNPANLTEVVALDSSPSLAGTTTKDYDSILSNFFPLEIIDSSSNTETYLSQLVKHNDQQYIYNATLFGDQGGNHKNNMLRISNRNSIPIEIHISSNVPGDVCDIFNIDISSTDTLRIHDAKDNEIRVISFDVPARGEIDLEVIYEVLYDFSFPVDLSFVVSY